MIDGNKFNTRCREAGEQRKDIIDECEVRDGGPLSVRSSRLHLGLGVGDQRCSTVSAASMSPLRRESGG